MISTRRPPLTPSNPADRPFTILCIEDDPGIARIYERRLTAFGARVLLRASGRDGFAAAAEAAPDLILLDNVLPDEEGVHLVKRLRSNPATAHIPVLMLTGSHRRGIERRVLVEGIAAVLEKPVNFDELFDHIRRIVPQAGTVPTSDAASPHGNAR
ncbi:MAG TPA: response regulator [Planctomycetaceae bacterium]|nr:response regulator [Planctomycetaceae bacterium]